MGQVGQLRPGRRHLKAGIAWAGAVAIAGASAVRLWPHVRWWLVALTAALAVLVPLLVSLWTEALAHRAETARLVREQLQGTGGRVGDEPPIVGSADLGTRVHRAVVAIPYVRRDKEEEVRELLKSGRPVLLVG